MKLLIVLGVVALVLFLVRGARRGVADASQRQAGAPRVEEMVRCARCGLHLPRSDALPGRGGVFCGAQHRAEHEREHPAA